MARKSKKPVKMVDMSGRLQVEIVPATEEELEQAEKELEELSSTIDNKVKQYEEELYQQILKILESECENTLDKITDKDSNYFIETYGYMTEKTPRTDIEERVKQFQSSLQRNHKPNIS